MPRSHLRPQPPARGWCWGCPASSGTVEDTEHLSNRKYHQVSHQVSQEALPGSAPLCSRDPNTLVFQGQTSSALAVTLWVSGSPQNCNISGMETEAGVGRREQQLLKPDFLRLLCILSLQILGHGQRRERSGTQRTGAGGDHEPWLYWS